MEVVYRAKHIFICVFEEENDVKRLLRDILLKKSSWGVRARWCPEYFDKDNCSIRENNGFSDKDWVVDANTFEVAVFVPFQEKCADHVNKFVLALLDDHHCAKVVVAQK